MITVEPIPVDTFLSGKKPVLTTLIDDENGSLLSFGLYKPVVTPGKKNAHAEATLMTAKLDVITFWVLEKMVLRGWESLCLGAAFSVLGALLNIL